MKAEIPHYTSCNLENIYTMGLAFIQVYLDKLFAYNLPTMFPERAFFSISSCCMLELLYLC